MWAIVFCCREISRPWRKKWNICGTSVCIRIQFSWKRSKDEKPWVSIWIRSNEALHIIFHGTKLFAQQQELVLYVTLHRDWSQKRVSLLPVHSHLMHALLSCKTSSPCTSCEVPNTFNVSMKLWICVKSVFLVSTGQSCCVGSQKEVAELSFLLAQCFTEI